jgi:hypothetical protein
MNYSTSAPFTSITDSSLGMSTLDAAFNDPLSFKKHNIVKQDALNRQNFNSYINGLGSRNDIIVSNCNIIHPQRYTKSSLDDYLDKIPTCNNCKQNPISLNQRMTNQIFK